MKREEKIEEQLEKTNEDKIEKKAPVIIELGDAHLDDVVGGTVAYRCAPT